MANNNPTTDAHRNNGKTAACAYLHGCKVCRKCRSNFLSFAFLVYPLPHEFHQSVIAARQATTITTSIKLCLLDSVRSCFLFAQWLRADRHPHVHRISGKAVWAQRVLFHPVGAVIVSDLYLNHRFNHSPPIALVSTKEVFASFA